MNSGIATALPTMAKKVDQIPGEQGHSKVLEYYSVNYSIADTYYLQVGEITRVQGWILHLSVVISQVDSLLNLIIPKLLAENVAFRIAMDKETCDNILQGHLGFARIGKIVAIYPSSDAHASIIAKEMMELTANHKGPDVPTDYNLGNIVYTRYGAFEGILKSHEENSKKYIYDKNMELTLDEYKTPFEIPNGVDWPFNSITPYSSIKQNQKPFQKFKVLHTLKEDCRGNVYIGLFLKRLIFPVPCVIKMGNKNMASDVSGRDINDRLEWQKDVYYILGRESFIPKILGFFKENGNGALIMKYIKGNSLTDFLKKVNENSVPWHTLTKIQSIRILKHIIRITEIISALHEKGIVHRDIAPGNFMVTKQNDVFLIDLELSYSISENRPHPPFSWGTPGFMSPEQKAIKKPTLKEDIYGMGALLLYTFTNLPPIKFDIENRELLYENLIFFIRNSDIVNLILGCLDSNPEKRPNIQFVRESLIKFKETIQSERVVQKGFNGSSQGPHSNLETTISLALNGLMSEPYILSNSLWYSKITRQDALRTPINKDYKVYSSIYNGVSGILYLLSKAKMHHFDIDPSMTAIEKGIAHINKGNSLTENTDQGLYFGTAGIALSLAKCIESGLLQYTEENSYQIYSFLSGETSDNNLISGNAGKGIAVLRCLKYIDHELGKSLLENIIHQQISFIQNEIIPKQSSDKVIISRQKHFLSFGIGITGILWFLLEYTRIFNDKQIASLTFRYINKILEGTHADIRKPFSKKFNSNEVIKDSQGDEKRGMILLLIKAYEIFKEPLFKSLAEKNLGSYADYLISWDFSLGSGLAGVGELYLEAFRVFGNEKWKQKADVIASVYLHTYNKTLSDGIYWLLEDDIPGADLMTGNSGIIHFLLGCYKPELFTYRLLG